MEGRYAKEGSERQTDEFMKPIILNKEGLVKGSKINYYKNTVNSRYNELALSNECTIESHFDSMYFLCFGYKELLLILTDLPVCCVRVDYSTFPS